MAEVAIQAPLQIIDKKQQQFEEFVTSLNPNFAFYVDGNGCAISQPFSCPS